jgi:hypothetical protein
MPLLLHSPDFWIGFAAAYLLLALLMIILLAALSPELRNVRWPALPSTLSGRYANGGLGVVPSACSQARLGRSERAAGRTWPHDDYAANEEGELRPADWRRDASPLPWDQARHTGGEL